MSRGGLRLGSRVIYKGGCAFKNMKHVIAVHCGTACSITTLECDVSHVGSLLAGSDTTAVFLPTIAIFDCYLCTIH